MAPEKTKQELIGKSILMKTDGRKYAYDRFPLTVASEDSEEPEAFIYDEHSNGRVKVVPYAQVSQLLHN